MNDPTTSMKPALKKAKNAFHILKDAQKKIKIVPSPLSKAVLLRIDDFKCIQKKKT